MATKLPRFTITLSPKSSEFLEALAKAQKCSKSKALDRLIIHSITVTQLLERMSSKDESKC